MHRRWDTATDIYDQEPPFRVEVAKAFVEHNTSMEQCRNAPIPPDVGDRIRSDPGAEMFTHKHAPADLLLQRVTHNDLPAREGSERLAELRELRG